MSQAIRRHETLALLVIILAVLGAGLAYVLIPEPLDPSLLQKPKPPNLEQIASQYDWKRAKENLEAIGRGIQIYRKAHGVKAVSQRQTPEDAGMPAYGLEALAEPGKPWSVPLQHFYRDPEMAAIKPRMQLAGQAGRRSYRSLIMMGYGPRNPDYRWPGKPWPVLSHWPFDYNPSYLAAVYMVNPPEAPRYWSLRGDEMPIVLDMNAYNSYEVEILKSKEPVRALVLRLNGRVDEIQYRFNDMRDLFLNR